MAQLPTGTVTFLFTDIEGSTKLLQQLGDEYTRVLAEHQAILRLAFAEHDGVEVDTQGDSFFVAFPTAQAAIAAAVQATRDLASHPWPSGVAVRVRMGLHTGAPQVAGERYVGLDVHRAARIGAAGHGGQILLSPTTRELASHTLPEGMTLRDLGAYQLKDFPQPEHLYQLVLPGLPDTFPRLKSLDRPPHDLPPQAPGYVGHSAELQATQAALTRPQAAVAIIGLGGIGKSSLAAEVVATLAEGAGHFPGGTGWVRCDERTDLDGLAWTLDQLLAAWEVSLSPDALRDVTTLDEQVALRERALRERLQGKATPALAFLDNVEQGLPLQRVLDLALPLDLRILVTSRVELAESRVRLVRLESLPDAEGVQLFAERYTAKGGAWDEARDRSAAERIVTALGGLPLAIELVAARAARKRLPLAVVAEELQAPTVLARLQDPLDTSANVRYSLGKTLAALPSEQRLPFAALGLPDGPDWPALVIERMYDEMGGSGQGAGDKREGRGEQELEALASYSLVSFVAGESGQRVRLHPLVRELAREEWRRLNEETQRLSLRALVSSVAQWVEQRQPMNANNFRILSADAALIEHTVRMAVAQSVALPHVFTLIEQWLDFVPNIPHQREILDLQLAGARHIGDRAAELTALSSIGMKSMYIGRPREALRYYEEALALARALNDRLSVVNLLCSVTDVASDLPDHGNRDIERLYEETTQAASELSEAQLGAFGMLLGLGNIAKCSKHYVEAEHWYNRALQSIQATGEQRSFDEGKIQANLGFLHDELGHLEVAQQHFERQVELGRALGDYPYAIGVGLNGLGQIALKQGDLDTAGRVLQEALSCFEQAGGTGMAAQVQGNLVLLGGLQALRQRENQIARQAFEEALSLFEEKAGGPGVDQKPFVRQLLEQFQAPLAVTTPEAPASAPSPPDNSSTETRPAVEKSALRRRTSWWPWKR
jgi:class 3 adenylate cyclase/tetratricopeptide (TPR) repeat protein